MLTSPVPDQTNYRSAVKNFTNKESLDLLINRANDEDSLYVIVNENQACETSQTITENIGFSRDWLLRHYLGLDNTIYKSQGQTGASYLFYTQNSVFDFATGLAIKSDGNYYDLNGDYYNCNIISCAHLYDAAVPSVSCGIALGDLHSSTNYYHFCIRVVPYLAIARKLINSCNAKIVLYGPHDQQWQRQWFEICGINNDDIITLCNPIFRSSSLYVFSETDPVQSSPRLKQNIVDSLLHYSYPDFIHGEKLFVLREAERPRSLANSCEAIALASSLGYKAVYLENMSVRAQLDLFYGASCIVGLHGAGLVNTFLCRPNSSLIELSSTHLNTCFLNVCSSASVAYGYVLDPSIFSADPCRWSPVYGPFAINLGLLEYAFVTAQHHSQLC